MADETVMETPADTPKTKIVRTPLGERLARIREKADEQVAVMQQMNASAPHAPTAAVGSVATVVLGLVTELEAAYTKLGEPLETEVNDVE